MGEVPATIASPALLFDLYARFPQRRVRVTLRQYPADRAGLQWFLSVMRTDPELKISTQHITIADKRWPIQECRRFVRDVVDFECH